MVKRRFGLAATVGGAVDTVVAAVHGDATRRVEQVLVEAAGRKIAVHVSLLSTQEIS